MCVCARVCVLAACSDVRHVTVRLGLVATQTDTDQDKLTISLFVRSFLPTVAVIQHYFALPTQRFD